MQPPGGQVKGLSHEGFFHHRSVDLGDTILYHYFKNYGHRHFLAVGDVGIGHRGTSVMIICIYLVTHTNFCYQSFYLTRICVGDEFFQLLPVFMVGDSNHITFATKSNRKSPR